MKTFVFVRGISTSFKEEIIDLIMDQLNPSINTVRAIRIDITQRITDPTDKNAIKAADRTCKNLVRKVLFNSNESHIVITNESLLPQHWQAYYELANAGATNAVAIGIDVTSPVDIITDDQKGKINLQEKNLPLFIASVYKYQQVKSHDDLKGIMGWF